MNPLKLWIPLLLSTLCCADAPSFEEVPSQITLPILTPALKERKSAKIELENGLQAYLVSDPKADQSAAALLMEVGSWDDNLDYPGIAHFTEHLLFMGSQTYPDENAYTKEVLQNGGMLNAFTSSDSTCYIFSINNDAFPKALDMFAHMFIDPLFNPSSIERELHAVDQEHDRSIDNDSWRFWMLLKENCNPTHPIALFTTGNSSTLGQIPRSAVMEWHRENYSSDRAHLALYSNLPIEHLKELTVASFSAIPYAKAPKKESTLPLRTAKQRGELIVMEPLKETRSLIISWELPQGVMEEWEDGGVKEKD